MKKIAVVTGSHGQDGSYLCKLLLEKNYRVIAADRRSSRNTDWRHISLGIENDLERVDFDLNDSNSIFSIFQKYKNINEFYNLAAQSFVKASFDVPIETANSTAFAVLNILDTIKHYQPKTKFYQASSSEMFGETTSKIQDEKTIFYPRSPYAVSKVFGHEMTRNYRESYGLFACSGILFNHESPLRGEEFVTKKIVKNLVQIKFGQKEFLELGNIYSKRDWGFAGDYVEAMWKMLQQKKADDYVICTSKTYSVKQFVNYCCQILKIPIIWKGKGLNEFAINKSNNKKIIKINKKFYRPAEVNYLRGSYLKAKKKLNWEPKISLKKLIEMMIEFEIKNLTESF